jgi:hypothetical protein
MIFTTWISYNGLIGVTKDGEYYELKTGKKLNREYHNGALYYRANKSKKRYSWNKINIMKKEEVVQVMVMPF